GAADWAQTIDEQKTGATIMRRAFATAAIPLLAVLAGGAGSGGCSSDSNQAPDGGRAGGGGSGTAGAAMVNCGDPYAPIDPTALIDDMENPAYATVMEAGRNGAWWTGGDPSSPGAAIQPNGNADAELIPGGRCGSKYAEHVTGHGFIVWAVLSGSMGWRAVDGGLEGLRPTSNT